MTVTDKIHKFEKAGLGNAPFAFVGTETAADRAGIQREREGNGLTFTTNYSTTCDYCGTAIQNAYFIKSACGKVSKVGCECIKKTGDAGLAKVVSDDVAAKRRAANRKRQETKWARQNALVEAFRQGRCDSLKSIPHPKQLQGKTAWDYCMWCIKNHCVGEAVCKLIEDSLTDH